MFEFLIHIDRVVFIFFNQVLVADWVDPIAILLSSKWAWIPLYVLIVYHFYKKFNLKMWVPLLMCLLVFGLSDSISTRVFKANFKRTRPCNVEELHARIPDTKSKSYGFVSSHAANTAALYFLVVLLLQVRGKKAALWLSLPLLIGWSRVYLGVHYPFDIVGGWILGVALALLVWWLGKRYLGKFIAVA